jgi:HK97 family phage portal protein
VTLFGRRREPVIEEQKRHAWPTIGFDQWLAQAAPQSWAGSTVTIESAMRHAAVAACVRVLVSTVASLPVDVVRATGGVRSSVDPQPDVVRMPSARVRQRGWVAQVVRSLLTAGNAYGLITATGAGGREPQSVEVIDPSSLTWRTEVGELVPYIDGKPHYPWPRGDLFHIAASAFLPPGSPVAQSPVDLARQSIGTGLAAEEFGARFLGDGGHPSAILYADQKLEKPQADEIKASFLNATRGNREPAVMGSGLKYERIQVDPSDSQFIDLMRFEVEQACRFFGVPPTMVYAAISGQNITYANITHNDLHYLKYSVGIWLADVEDAWSSLLSAPLQVKFKVDAMLRMDAKARHELYSLRLKDRTMTIPEVRSLEDEPPLDDVAERMGARELSEALQKIYLSVGKVISADEAREILNREGADLVVPGPVEFPPKETSNE